MHIEGCLIPDFNSDTERVQQQSPGRKPISAKIRKLWVFGKDPLKEGWSGICIEENVIKMHYLRDKSPSFCYDRLDAYA